MDMAPVYRLITLLFSLVEGHKSCNCLHIYMTILCLSEDQVMYMFTLYDGDIPHC